METSRSTGDFSRMLVSRGCERRERGSEQKSSTVLLVHGMGAENVRFESKLLPVSVTGTGALACGTDDSRWRNEDQNRSEPAFQSLAANTVVLANSEGKIVLLNSRTVEMFG